MDAREESWRAEGWTGYQAAEAADRSRDMTGSTLRRLLSANLSSMRRTRVRSRSSKRTCASASAKSSRAECGSAPTSSRPRSRRKSICAARRCIWSASRSTGRSAPAIAFVDRTIEATETAEEAVVSKEARVTEEISLEKAVDSRTETVRDTVRHTEVEVEDERLDRTK